MKIGVIGLGRMGANIVQRLIQRGHECVVYDTQSTAVASLRMDGATGAASMQEMVAQLDRPRGQADFSNRVLSAMRAGFGGHVEKTDA